MSLCLGVRSAPLVPRAGPSRFNHVKCLPSPALAQFVDHYWVTKWDRRAVAPRNAASLPDPCVHMLIQDGRAEIKGVMLGTLRMRIEGAGSVVGVRFRAGGFHAFVSRPVAEWTDRTVPANEVFESAGTAWARELSDSVAGCRGGADAHAAIATRHLNAFLGARLPARDAAAEHVAELVALIASSADVRRLSDLVRASGRSERTLHRLFERYVGASPAWVIRRYRLHAAAARLTTSPPADVRDVAWDLGYADQAHFIRDFRAMIGVTPGAYVQGRL